MLFFFVYQLFCFFNPCFGSIFPDALYTVFAGCFCLVSLGGEDDFAVAGFQAEAEFAGFVGVNFKFRVGFSLKVLNGLIFELRGFGVFADAFDSVKSAVLGAVVLGASDDFAVGGDKIEMNTLFSFFYYEFSHGFYSFKIIF